MYSALSEVVVIDSGVDSIHSWISWITVVLEHSIVVEGQEGSRYVKNVVESTTERLVAAATDTRWPTFAGISVCFFFLPLSLLCHCLNCADAGLVVRAEW